MKLPKNAILKLAGEGKITLEVAEKVSDSEEFEDDEEIFEDFPNEWFVRLRPSLDMPSIRKQSGKLFLTKRGFLENYDDLKMVFEVAVKFGGAEESTWEEFEEYAQKHFKKLEDNMEKRIKLLQDEVDELKKVAI